MYSIPANKQTNYPFSTSDGVSQTSFVNKYKKKETIFTKSMLVSSETIDLFTDKTAILN